MICTHFLLGIKTCHGHKPSIKLYWTKDEHHNFPFYSSVMPRDRYLTILKYLHFADNQTHQHKTGKFPTTTNSGNSEKYLIF